MAVPAAEPALPALAVLVGHADAFGHGSRSQNRIAQNALNFASGGFKRQKIALGRVTASLLAFGESAVMERP